MLFFIKMLINLDKTDLKILHELDKNSKKTYSDIAKEVNLSKQSVKKRIDNLVEKKIITNFITIINSSNFGIIPNQTFIALNPCSEQRKSEFFEYLTNSNDIAQITTCEGLYDIYFGIAGKDLGEIDEKLSDICTKFSDIIKNKINLIMVDTRLFPRDFLIDKNRELIPKNKGFHSRINKFFKINGTDKKILLFLSNNPKTSMINMAKNLNISVQGVINRVKYLEANKIIIGYMYLLNEKIFTQVLILLDINPLPKNIEIKIFQYFASHPNIIFVVKYLGEYNFSITLEAKNFADYKKFSEDFKKEFSHHIKTFIPLINHEIKKIRFLPQDI